MANDCRLLNEHQQRRLLITCQHIDKMLTDVELALAESAARKAFPEYIPDISPAQRRVIEDYIARMRAQLMRVLKGQGIDPPPPRIAFAENTESKSAHWHLPICTQQ